MDELKEDAALIASLRALSRSLGVGGSELGPHPEDAAFASYVSGTLEAAERERFERHVAACDRCAEDLAAVARVEATAEGQSRAAPQAHASADAGDAWRRAASSVVAERPEPSSPRRGRGGAVSRKVVRRLAIAAVAVLVVSVGLVAAGNLLLARMAPTAAARLGAMVGRPVQIGDLALAFVPEPALRVRDLRVPDDPRFSSGDVVSLGSADLAVDPRSLWQGRLYGSVRLQQPTLRLIRDAVGEWNVETLAGGSSDPAALDSIEDRRPSSAGPAEEAKVRLVSADITSGTLAVTDRSGGHERELVLHDVDVAYRAVRATEPSTVALEGKLGGRSVVLRGEIGPFEGHAPPQYRFAEVSLADVDLSDIPGAPAAMTGRMTFTGRLEGAGSSLGAIVQSATGGGSLDLCCGTLAQRNLDRDLVAALESVVGVPGRLAGRLADEPATAAELAAATTGYQRLGGRVEIDRVRLAFAELGAQTRLFTAVTSGGVARDGHIDVNGKVNLGPELTQALLAAAPALGAALEKGGAPRDAIALPFALEGRWPDVVLRVDVASTLRNAGRAIDPRRLVWSLRRPLARG